MCPKLVKNQIEFELLCHSFGTDGSPDARYFNWWQGESLEIAMGSALGLLKMSCL